MQKIHYVTLLYAIKFHNVQRNVSNLNTFDEHYRNESQNLEKSKRWHLYIVQCLRFLDFILNPLSFFRYSSFNMYISKFQRSCFLFVFKRSDCQNTFRFLHEIILSLVSSERPISSECCVDYIVFLERLI